MIITTTIYRRAACDDRKLISFPVNLFLYFSHTSASMDFISVTVVILSEGGAAELFSFILPISFNTVQVKLVGSQSNIRMARDKLRAAKLPG